MVTCHFLSSALADLMLGSSKERPYSEPANSFPGILPRMAPFALLCSPGGKSDWPHRLDLQANSKIGALLGLLTDSCILPIFFSTHFLYC